MLKRFKCSVRRYYGELEDDFEYELGAKDKLDMLLILVADLGGIQAQNEIEAKEKAKLFLDEELGDGWTTDKFFNSRVELWTDNIMCYEVRDIEEVEIETALQRH